MQRRTARNPGPVQLGTYCATRSGEDTLYSSIAEIGCEVIMSEEKKEKKEDSDYTPVKDAVKKIKEMKTDETKSE
jgi:hypothetical protein